MNTELSACIFLALWSAALAEVVVTTGSWSSPIEESGKNTGGTSTYECSNFEVLVGREHEGDENGSTEYLCGSISNDGVAVQPIVGQSQWSQNIQESGKDQGGTSSYECPVNQVMIGRKHSGDENGNTQYECSVVGTADGAVYFVNAQDWSQWIQESGKSTGGISIFQCPENQVIIGREHSGDENGNTRYRCGIPYLP